MQTVRFLAAITLGLIKSKHNILFLRKTEVIALCPCVAKAEIPSSVPYSSPLLPQILHHKCPAEHKHIVYLQVSPLEVRIANAIVKAQKALRKQVVLTPRESHLCLDYFQLQ